MWMSLADIEMATASTPQSMECSTSETTARFQARMEASSPRPTISLDRLLLVAAHRGDAHLDLMDADVVEQTGDTDLLVVGEDDAGRLLAVAQSRVVDAHRRFGGLALR